MDNCHDIDVLDPVHAVYLDRKLGLQTVALWLTVGLLWGVCDATVAWLVRQCDVRVMVRVCDCDCGMFGRRAAMTMRWWGGVRGEV